MWEIEFFWFSYEQKIQKFQKNIKKYFSKIFFIIWNFLKTLRESSKKKKNDMDFENTEWYQALQKDLNLKLISARRSEEKFLYPIFL